MKRLITNSRWLVIVTVNRIICTCHAHIKEKKMSILLTPMEMKKVRKRGENTMDTLYSNQI